jgi:hypothetical protein
LQERIVLPLPFFVGKGAFVAEDAVKFYCSGSADCSILLDKEDAMHCFLLADAA